MKPKNTFLRQFQVDPRLKKNLKIGLSPVGTMYSTRGPLRNAITCFYGSSSSAFFDL